MTTNETPLKAFKDAEAAANTQRIADAITAMQRAGQRINISSVARATGLERNTIRARADLLKEIKDLHTLQSQRPPLTHATHRDAADYKDMQARWKTAMAEVKRLREENAQLRQQVHQDLSRIESGDHQPLQEAQAEVTRLNVSLANLQVTNAQLNQRYSDLNVEANEAHQLNRNYVRFYNRIPAEVRDKHPLERVRNT